MHTASTLFVAVVADPTLTCYAARCHSLCVFEHILLEAVVTV